MSESECRLKIIYEKRQTQIQQTYLWVTSNGIDQEKMAENISVSSVYHNTVVMP